MTERPSVLHFTTTGAIAGTEQAVLDLSEAHDRRKWQVSFGTLFSPGEMNLRIQQNGAPCYSMGVASPLDIPISVVRLAILLRRLKIDVLHTHLVHAGLVGVFAARLSGLRSIKLVHTRHHSDELHRFGPAYKAKMDAYVAHAQHLVCANSEAARSVLTELEGVSASKIRLTYPGVHLTRLYSRVTDPSGESIRRELGYSEDHQLVGSVAHLLPKKGHEYLLRAMVAVVDRDPMARLVIAGRGPERERLEQLTRDLGIIDFVQFLGYRGDIPNVVNTLDLLVQPSLEEAFGLSMVEGMALGKPIVGSNVGGIPEVIDSGVTGTLTPPGDARALAEAILNLLADSAMRTKFGSAGRDRAERLFTIPRLAADYESAWSEVLDHE